MITNNNFKQPSFRGYNFPNSTSKQARNFINKEISEQANSIASAIRDVHASYKKQSNLNESPFGEFFKNFKKIFGIEKVNDKIEDGIIFDGKDKNIIISVHEYKNLRIREQNKTDGTVTSAIYIKGDQIAKTDTTKKVPSNIQFMNSKTDLGGVSDYLKDLFEQIDTRLLQMRRRINNPQKTLTEDVFEPVSVKNIESIKRERLSNTVNVEPKETINHRRFDKDFIKGVIDGAATKDIDDIKNMFYEVHDLLKTVSNPNVRSKIRNGYPGLKAYISDVKNPSKALAFQRDDGGVLSVNIMNFRNDKYLIFQLQDVQGKCKNYFVNKNGELLLVNQFIGGHIQSHISNGRYFSQDELDAFGYHKFFTEIKNCLAGYKEYVNKSVEQINK